MSEIPIYPDLRAIDIYYSKVVKSARKHGYEIYFVLQRRVGPKAAANPYRKKTIAAVLNGKVTLVVRVNRKGSVSWDRVWGLFQDTYRIGEKINVDAEII